MKKCKHCQTEIDDKAKICPNCRKKQGMPKWLIIVLVIVGIAIIGSALGNNDEPSNDNDPSGTTGSKEKFTLEEGHNGYVGDYGIGYYIEGYVKNNEDREFTYVSIEFNLYDADGALIGTAIDNINNLEENGKWKFKAGSLLTSDQSYQVASYKLKEISGW